MQNLENGRYDSVADFIASLVEFRRPDLNRDYADRVETESDAKFLGGGCGTFSDVKRVIADGWRAGQDTVSKLLDQTSGIEATPQDRRRRLARGDYGDTLDMGAVYRGRFDVAWSRAVRRPSYAPQQVDIVANMVCAAFENNSVLQWRGVAAIALADKLEAAGYMVRIVVAFGGKMRSDKAEKMSCRVTVKDYDKPLDICTTASVTLPGFFRSLGFSWILRHADSSVYMGISAGNGEGNFEPGELVVSHNVRDRDSALAFVNRHIAKFNTPQAA